MLVLLELRNKNIVSVCIDGDVRGRYVVRADPPKILFRTNVYTTEWPEWSFVDVPLDPGAYLFGACGYKWIHGHGNSQGGFIIQVDVLKHSSLEDAYSNITTLPFAEIGNNIGRPDLVSLLRPNVIGIVQF
jgi:hypothetical protein